MEVRQATNPADVKHYTTERLRREFLVEGLFEANKINMVYSHYDRLVVGGVLPVDETLRLEDPETLKTDYFLERREVGFLHIGGGIAVIAVDGKAYELSKLDVLYVGKGRQDVTIASKDKNDPAKIYLVSATAHAEHPTRKMTTEEANPTHLGSLETSNERVLNKYIHADGIQSCQLMLGVTALSPGSVWNTMPAHVHDRRMEAYLYFDLNDDARIFHMMGEPAETRHLIAENEQAILSPPWSIHSGVGTSNYSFCWAMAGENYTFSDQEFIPMKGLR
ncbi:4-deoxy-L-threo-5-hexulose uronate isomerase [Paenibacillaceae bacterium GAS479]|nr:4-deoxy-L-threo-5-hexulose uronate isomerase [Paenibacillaceae bacterium GAS479]